MKQRKIIFLLVLLVLLMLLPGCAYRRFPRREGRQPTVTWTALPVVETAVFTASPTAIASATPATAPAETVLIPSATVTETPIPTVTPTEMPTLTSTVTATTVPTMTPTPFQNILGSGNHPLKMTVDGRERTYILHVPSAAQDSQPLPLIVVLHGSYGTGRKMQLALGFDSYADAYGFYVAYPDAYQTPGENETARWNDGRGTLESSDQDIDDVAFLTGMVSEIGSLVAVDRSQVFVTGASNGGIMSYRLGCETSGVFTGIAPVIANIAEPIYGTCQPQPAIKFLAINGDADTFIPFEGGEVCSDVSRLFCEGGFVRSFSESVGRFAVANGCAASPQITILPMVIEDGTFVEEQRYTNCASGASVSGYIIHNGGHTWPPLKGQLDGSGQPTGNLDATELIVKFFLGISE